MSLRLINGDCLDEMQKLLDDDVKVDMILTDPPYGIGYSRHIKGHRFENQIQNDTTYDTTYEAIQLIGKLIKPTGACYIFGQDTTLPEQYKAIEDAGLRFKNLLVWEKTNAFGMGDLKTSYAKKTEFVVYSHRDDGRHELNGVRNHNILSFKALRGRGVNKPLHQNQKPTDLLSFLIEKSSNPNDTVLDPFMGVGSTGVACINLNRDFIGIELDEKYFNIAKERCNKISK